MSRARDLANLGDGIDATQITSGVFADGRVQASNVTQHEGSIDALASNPTVTLGSNTTFPTKVTDHTYFYYLRQPGQKPSNSGIGFYLGTENVENRFQYFTAIAPTNFTSVQDIICWFICTQTPPNGGTSAPYIPSMDFGWQIGSNGNNYNQHSLSLTTVSGYSTDLVNRLNAVNCTNVGSSGNRFQDKIGAGDAFGMGIDLNGGFARSALGISIKWRF